MVATFPGGEQLRFAWSPEGRRLAVTGMQDRRPHLWTVDLGTLALEERPATRLGGSGLELTWSPGRRILYQGDGNTNLFYLDVE